MTPKAKAIVEWIRRTPFDPAKHLENCRKIGLMIDRIASGTLPEPEEPPGIPSIYELAQRYKRKYESK